MNSDKYMNLRQEQIIRNILITDWDPIGINSNPNLRDEYDIYINEIFQLIKNNESIESIVRKLENIEKEDIGACTNSCIRYEVALKLKSCVSNVPQNLDKNL